MRSRIEKREQLQGGGGVGDLVQQSETEGSAWGQAAGWVGEGSELASASHGPVTWHRDPSVQG